MKRIITNNDYNGQSYIVSQTITNIEVPLPEIDERFKFYNLWATDTMPVILGKECPIYNKYVSTSPVKNGSMFRIVNYPPDQVLLDKINRMTKQELRDFETKIGIKLSFDGKHPLMHITKSIDFGIVLTGEIYLVLDKEENLLKPTDTIIQNGTSHAWSNRSNQDCLIAYVLLDAEF